MKSPLLRLLCLATIALTSATPILRAAEPAIITKARAYLGTEAALNAVNTLHYSGKLELSDMDADGPEGPITIEIIFERPYHQRSTVTSERGTEITVLNGYDAWQRVSAANDDTRWNLTLLQIPQIKNLRANAWENLSFFRGLEEAGGQIEDLGVTTMDDQTCRKLAFIHSPEVVFYRYFNVATGRLVLTETMRGERIREIGGLCFKLFKIILQRDVDIDCVKCERAPGVRNVRSDDVQEFPEFYGFPLAREELNYLIRQLLPGKIFPPHLSLVKTLVNIAEERDNVHR